MYGWFVFKISDIGFLINRHEIKITKATANTVLIIKALLSLTAFKISFASSDTTI